MRLPYNKTKIDAIFLNTTSTVRTISWAR